MEGGGDGHGGGHSHTHGHGPCDCEREFLENREGFDERWSPPLCPLPFFSLEFAIPKFSVNSLSLGEGAL